MDIEFDFCVLEDLIFNTLPTYSAKPAEPTNTFRPSTLLMALAITSRSDLVEASFNLGDALYKQNKYDQAIKQFEISANLSNDNLFKSKSYHNLGNSYLKGFETDDNPETKMQKLDLSIEAYKNALKNNPKDYDSKYNLSYALRLRNQQQNSNQNKDNQDQQQRQKEQQQKEKQQQRAMERPRKIRDYLSNIYNSLWSSETAVMITMALLVGLGGGFGSVVFRWLIDSFQHFFSKFKDAFKKDKIWLKSP